MDNKPGKRVSRKTTAVVLALEAVIIVVVLTVLLARDKYYISLTGPRPDVVIFLVDALRADRLSCYGHTLATSPFIDRLAGKGVLFSNCRSQAPWTKPSVASLFTSVYSSTHGVIAYPRIVDGAFSTRLEHSDLLPSGLTTLAEAFKADGYITAAFVSNRWVDPVFGFDQGFDYFLALPASEARVRDGRPVAILNVPADIVHARLLEWVTELRPHGRGGFHERFFIYKRPLFVYVHYMDVHAPYHPPQPFTGMFEGYYRDLPDSEMTEEQIKGMGDSYLGVNSINLHQARYDAQIRYLDSELEKLFAFLARQELFPGAMMAFTSDHGEAFLEHGTIGHGDYLFEEEIRIPLIIWGPHMELKGALVDKQVELIDLGPTLLHMAGLPPVGQFVGSDVMGPVTAESVSWSENYIKGHSQAAMIEKGKKWIYDTGQKEITGVYDFAEDPKEKLDLKDDVDAKTRAAVGKRVEKWLAGNRSLYRPLEGDSGRELTEEVRKQLEALGYLDRH